MARSTMATFSALTTPSRRSAASCGNTGSSFSPSMVVRGPTAVAALASTGLLSEGAGENLFLVFDGTLHTPPVSAALLNGITRHTIATLAREAGIEVVERDLPREYLYLCDELFMCGTAAEITPIRSVAMPSSPACARR